MAEPHTFHLLVAVRRAGTNEAFGFMPQEIRAYSLQQALRKAEQIPLMDWFEPEDAGQLAQDPLYQIAMGQTS